MVAERQRLIDQIAQRDEVIARQAAEIVILKQTIKARDGKPVRRVA